MSDTDDTDGLLASDPGGGLEMFLGLSLKELADKHQNIFQKSEFLNPSENVGAEITTDVSCNSSSEPKPIQETLTSATDSTQNNLDELDTSDFFNSRGEIVLSGLSEWSDSDVEDAQSDAGSEASFTFENVPQSKSLTSGILKSNEENDDQIETLPDLKETEQNDDKYIDEREKEIVIDTSKHRNQNIVTSSFKTFLDMSFGRTPSLVPRNANFGRVVDINLLKPASGWDLPFPDNTGQVFTRAPNFRTPGGYKPPEEPEDCRELTEDQIHEEVLRMYAFPDELDNTAIVPHKDPNCKHHKVPSAMKDNIINDIPAALDSTKNKSIKHQRTSKVRFDFANGDPPIFGSEPTDEKAMKRKHLISAPERMTGAGDGGSTTPTSPMASNPQVRYNVSETTTSVVEKPRSPAKKVTYSTKVVRGKRSADKKKSSGFSFGYGESENELSPIRAVGMDMYNTPGSISSVNEMRSQPNGMASAAYSLADLKTVWKEIQDRKLILEAHGNHTSEVIQIPAHNDVAFEHHHPTSIAETLGSDIPDQIKTIMSQSDILNDSLPTTANNVSSSSSPSTQLQPQASSYLAENRSVEFDHKYLPLLESFASDLESILLEADINPAEFEDIIDDLKSGADMPNLFDVPLTQHFDTVEGDEQLGAEPSDIATQVQLSDWARSGAVEYFEKYQDERLRRDQCEIEIQRLQKELLEIKQQNAVLEGKMKKKDKLLFQISSAWNHVSKEWKTHEAMSQAALVKLQDEQNDLIAACTEGKERIDQYEKELIKTVELADSFKNKIIELEEAKTVAVMKIEDEKHQMAEIVGRMERDVDSLKNEKDMAIRLLKESESQLDERKAIHDNIQSQLETLTEQANENSKKFQTIIGQKDALESHLLNVDFRKVDVEKQLQMLTKELETVRMEKEDLRRNHENTAARQVKEEGDRLHEYYNIKVQEVLRSATEKATKAEATLINSIKRASTESEKRLSECRERHSLEITRLKAEYESELQELKKENLRKQLLITTTAEQLQSGEVARSSAMNRLQTIVSSMPDANTTSSEKATKNRKGNENSALEIAQNNIQYSKFTQNLSTSGCNHQHQLSSSQSTDFSGLRQTSSNSVRDSQSQDISRYNKTSTPITTCGFISDIANHTSPSKDDVLSKASKLCKYFETANSNLGTIFESSVQGRSDNFLNDPGPVINSFSVESLYENQNRRTRATLRNPVQVFKGVDPILENPVRLQKETGHLEVETVENYSSDPNAMIEPALQKCLQELIESYGQKLDVIQAKRVGAPVNEIVQIRQVPDNGNLSTEKQSQDKVKVYNTKIKKVSSNSNNCIPVLDNDTTTVKNFSVKSDKDYFAKDKTTGNSGNQTSGKRPWK